MTLAVAQPATKPEILRLISDRLHGHGIEFGAGSPSTAFPVTDRVAIRYADRNSIEQLEARDYFQGRDLLPIDFLTDMEVMEGIDDESVDFIIASHVIEHTRNPSLAIRMAHRKLREGGRLVLVVPDKEVTFDKDRPVTSIEHFMADDLRPCRERDFEHYLEFFRRCFPQPDPIASAQGVFERGDDIHYHTWTFESFAEFLDYLATTGVTWRDIWSHRRASDQDIDFFYVMTK